ncbi:hypothetical protein [Streptomyces sp. PU-14G]|uniref:hypothetical protein n=1 Tax=Streptomyces sp. PU-14G TaxID=2800808 RepID=UPI0034E02355
MDAAQDADGRGRDGRLRRARLSGTAAPAAGTLLLEQPGAVQEVCLTARRHGAV